MWCRAEVLADGKTNLLQTAADCGAACAASAKCNAWQWCGDNGGCFTEFGSSREPLPAQVTGHSGLLWIGQRSLSERVTAACRSGRQTDVRPSDMHILSSRAYLKTPCYWRRGAIFKRRSWRRAIPYSTGARRSS
jgi:hypothetical protein